MVFSSLSSKGRLSLRSPDCKWGKRPSYYLLGAEVITLIGESQKGGHRGHPGELQHGASGSERRISRPSLCFLLRVN